MRKRQSWWFERCYQPRPLQVDKSKDKAKSIEDVPEVFKVVAFLGSDFSDLNGKVPCLDRNKRDDKIRSPEEGGMEEDEEESKEQQSAFKTKELQRIFHLL